MELKLESPLARYGVATLTLPGRVDKYLDVGPVLVASYNRRDFEVLYPFRAVVAPLAWELHEPYGFLHSPDAAIWRFLRDKEAAADVLSQEFDQQYGERTFGAGGAAALEIPSRVRAAAEYVLAEREVGK